MKNRDEILRDEEAKELIGELYRKYRGTAAGIIHNLLGLQINKEDKEDLVQEGFLRLLYRAEDLVGRSEGEQYSFLCNCMRFVSIDAGRKISRRKEVSFSEVMDFDLLAALNVYGFSPEEKYVTEEEWEEHSQVLRVALSKLTEQDYRLLTERYYNELNDCEIGRRLKIKESFVRVYMDRARKRAAAHYREEIEKEKKRCLTAKK